MINRKQYVISKDRFVADEFLSIELQCGMILSYHRDMRVRSTDDRRTVLLGDAFSCVKDDAEPISEISLCRSRADVEDATSSGPVAGSCSQRRHLS